MDEIGYLPVGANGANLFFQLVNTRYEKASTVLTSNKSFKEWGEVFGDPVVASALLDRLLHHCHIVNIKGNSYRLQVAPDVLHPALPCPGLDLPDDPPPPRRKGRRPKTQEAPHSLISRLLPMWNIFAANSGTFSTAIDTGPNG